MSDGQTEACESIQQQNAVSVKLEPGESVKWHDGQQWRVGLVLDRCDGNHVSYHADRIVQCPDGVYIVDHNTLSPYLLRCDACDGSGQLAMGRRPMVMALSEPVPKCPECKGSGRAK